MEHKRTVNLTVSVSLAWWWPLYEHALVFFCRLMHTVPNPDKLRAMVLKALRVRITQG